jgi:HEAT repeat protein
MPGDGEPLVSDEDLFRWLHDPDDGVRRVCHSALVTRNRTEAEIALGCRLTNPDPRERLALLIDLRYGHELADPEPWLERLSHDIDPAVRAGAARAAVEIRSERRLGAPAWVDRVADTDPDATVRRVATYFRGLQLHAVGGAIRPAGGP